VYTKRAATRRHAHTQTYIVAVPDRRDCDDSEIKGVVKVEAALAPRLQQRRELHVSQRARERTSEPESERGMEIERPRAREGERQREREREREHPCEMLSARSRGHLGRSHVCSFRLASRYLICVGFNDLKEAGKAEDEREAGEDHAEDLPGDLAASVLRCALVDSSQEPQHAQEFQHANKA